ncbi:MAG: hypothetical protein JWO36_4151 [Myxococcales bacterium]|nr:hypothetical protein [Myxococcales bacterium]
MRFETVTPRAILVIAGLIIVLYGYPGLMTADTVDQLDMMRRWDLGDWQPPASAVLWKIVETFVGGPFGMLLLQTTAFVAGCFAVLCHELARKFAALVTLVICLLPPVLTTVGVVWKDTQMAGYLILGIGALMSERRRTRWLGLGMLFVASAMRHNAAAATLAPIALLWAPGLSRSRRLGCAAVAWIGITVASFAVNAALAERSEHPWTISVATTDVVGTVRWAPPLSDAELRSILDGTPLRVDHDIQAAFVTHYDPYGWNAYASADPPLGLPTTEAEDEAMARAWRELVTDHPAAYLRHRWTVFAKLLQLGVRPTMSVITTFTYDGDPDLAKRIHHDASPSTIQRALFAIENWVSSTRLIANCFAPFVYFVVACCLLIGAWRSPHVFAVVASGLVYELSFFIAAPSPDYRYSHWMIVTALLGMAMVFARRWRVGVANAAVAPAN